jgi:general stress protein 26
MELLEDEEAVMSELKNRILDILKQPQLSGLATITEDGKPWVRYVMAVAGEDLTVRCATFVGARKVAQIKENPEVHLTCGVTDPAKMVPYLQIQARAQLCTDEAERHGFWSDMLAPIFAGPDDPNYGVLVIAPYRIEVCSPGSMEPEVWTAECCCCA